MIINFYCEIKMEKKKKTKIIKIKNGKIFLVMRLAISIFYNNLSKHVVIREKKKDKKISTIRTKTIRPRVSRLKILLAKFCAFFLLFNNDE